MSVSEKNLKKNPVLGAMEVAIFMAQGVGRFGTDKRAMLLSFLLPLVLAPLSIYALYLSHPEQEEIAHLSFGYVNILFFFKGLFGIVLSLSLLYGFAKYYDRREHFYLTITALNWSALFPTLLFMPIVISMGLGWHNWDEVYNINVVAAIYSYCVTAFVMTYAFRIPWEMAGFLTICLLAINEIGFDILYWVAQS